MCVCLCVCALSFCRQPIPPLQFRYEEQSCPEEFFTPYIWQLVYQSSGIRWDPERILLFKATAPLPSSDSLARTKPATPPNGNHPKGGRSRGWLANTVNNFYEDSDEDEVDEMAAIL